MIKLYTSATVKTVKNEQYAPVSPFTASFGGLVSMPESPNLFGLIAGPVFFLRTCSFYNIDVSEVNTFCAYSGNEVNYNEQIVLAMQY